MFTFELTSVYIPHGKIADYKKKYGKNFGELTIASLSYQNIEAVTYISSDDNRVFTKVKKPVGKGKKDNRYDVPSPISIESILFDVVSQAFPNQEFPFSLRREYLSFIIFNVEEAKKTIESIYAQLLDDIADVFPFNLRYTLKPDRNEIDIYVYSCTTIEHQKVFFDLLDERFHQGFKFFDRVAYFDW